MNRCERCNINILDDTVSCPLCKSVLVREDNNPLPTYPVIKDKKHKLRILVKIFGFVAFIIELILVYINYKSNTDIWWSAITGIVFAYVCFSIGFVGARKYDHRTKLFWEIILAVALAIAIDVIIGFSGWSIRYVAPIIFLLADLIVFVIMLANFQYWQGYLVSQILLLTAVAICDIIAKVLDISSILLIIATAVTVFLLVGTILFGDKKARTELKRRFRV
ncbi:MAG: DUF6320 domain-containing protein [Wujia sp.]